MLTKIILSFRVVKNAGVKVLMPPTTAGSAPAFIRVDTVCRRMLMVNGRKARRARSGPSRRATLGVLHGLAAASQPHLKLPPRLSQVVPQPGKAPPLPGVEGCPELLGQCGHGKEVFLQLLPFAFRVAFEAVGVESAIIFA